MLLVTIANDAWLNTHLPRWFRYAQANSECELGLIHIGERNGDAEAFGWDRVVHFDGKHDYRKFYNTVRLDALKLFDVDEVLYCDCDADVYHNISDINMLDRAMIGACISPAMHDDWIRASRELFPNQEPVEYNNGFLHLKDKSFDYVDVYQKAFDRAERIGAKSRIIGTIAFNIMVQDEIATNDDCNFWEIPYCYSTIWWDYPRLPEAKCVQFCNDRGQAHRLSLEQTHKDFHAR